jgi:hypothetical protein
MNATQLAATLDLLHLHAESAAESLDEFAAKIPEPERYRWRYRAEAMRITARKFEQLTEELRGKETE